MKPVGSWSGGAEDMADEGIGAPRLMQPSKHATHEAVDPAPTFTITTPASWEAFVRDAWSKTPATLRIPDLGISESRLFGLLVFLSDRVRGGAPIPVRMFAETDAPKVTFPAREALPEDVQARCMPQGDDGGFERYAARVRKELGRGAALVVDNLELYDPELWMSVRRAFRGLFDRIELRSPQGMMAFVGDYASTPFGVHKDDDHVFHVCIFGKKRMRLWTREHVARHPELKGSMDYGAMLKDAITLEGEPGDVMYWPASYFHVGECVGAAADFSVGFQPARSVASEVWDEVARIVRGDLAGDPSGAEGDRVQDARDRRPRGDPSAVAAAREVIAARVEAALSDLRLDRALKTLWSNKRSADGFVNVPDPRRDAALDDDDRVRGDPAFPLSVVALDADEIQCSAHGHGVTLPNHPAIHALVARIDSGVESSVADLVEGVMRDRQCGDADLEVEPGEVRAILERFVAIRAIWRVGSRA